MYELALEGKLVGSKSARDTFRHSLKVYSKYRTVTNKQTRDSPVASATVLSNRFGRLGFQRSTVKIRLSSFDARSYFRRVFSVLGKFLQGSSVHVRKCSKFDSDYLLVINRSGKCHYSHFSKPCEIEAEHKQKVKIICALDYFVSSEILTFVLEWVFANGR